MNIRNVSALGRPIELNYQTNKVIVALTGLTMIAFFLIQWFNNMIWQDALIWSFHSGISVFLAWAVGRELDPDHDGSAFVSASLMMGLLWWFPLPSLLAVFWLMLLIRLLNRTVGLPPTTIDLLSILGFSAWLGISAGWIYGLLAALVFGLDQFNLKSAQKFAWPTLAALALTVIFLTIKPEFLISEVTVWILVSGGLISFLFALLTLTSPAPISVGDATSERLKPKRLKAAQLSAALVVVLFLLLQGKAGWSNLLPVWAAMLGMILFRLWQHLTTLFPVTQHR